MIVCPADEQVVVGFLCCGALTITPAIERVIKMMSFKKILNIFFSVLSACSSIDSGLDILCLLWPEQMFHRIKKCNLNIENAIS